MGRSLDQLARHVLARASSEIPACTSACHSRVERRGYQPSAGTDRAWRLAHDRHEAFCVVDDPSERTLLGWLVGGLGARVLSSIERSIVAESMRRLLVARDCANALHEEQRARPTVRAWNCDITLQGRDGGAATLQLYAEDDAPDVAQTACRPPDLRDVNVRLRASLPSVGVLLADVRGWSAGSLLRLQRAESNVAVTLALGAKRVAIAQLGSVDGRRAVRIIMVGVGQR